MCHHPSMSLNKEKVSREISENKIAVCEKTQGLRSGNFSDLNSAYSTVLVSSRKNISVPRHALRKSFSRHFSRPQQTAYNKISLLQIFALWFQKIAL